MNFIIGEVYLIISSLIEGALWIMAWNMCISVAFEVPTIAFIELFIIIYIAIGVIILLLSSICVNDSDSRKADITIAVSTITNIVCLVLYTPNLSNIL